MNVLEKMSFQVQPITKKFIPFKKWKGSPLKNYTVTFRILTVADQIEIGKAISNELAGAMLDIQRLQVLARTLVSINDQPVISDDELQAYRKDHGASESFSKYDYIIIFLKKFPVVVRDQLYFTYEDLQNEYTSQLLGEPLPDELKLNSQNKSSEPPEKTLPDQLNIQEDGNDTTITTGN